MNTVTELLNEAELSRQIVGQLRERLPAGWSLAVERDVRVIAATHRHLEAAVDAGDFREDLYYRLHVMPIVLPALRDRPDPAAYVEALLAEERRAADVR